LKKRVKEAVGAVCLAALAAGALHHINQVRALSVPEVIAEASEETLPVIDDHDPDPVTYIAQEPVTSYVHYDILEVDEF